MFVVGYIQIGWQIVGDKENITVIFFYIFLECICACPNNVFIFASERSKYFPQELVESKTVLNAE